MTINAIQPQRQPIGSFISPDGQEVPVFITVPWFRALNALASAAVSSGVQVAGTPPFVFGQLVYESADGTLTRLPTGAAGKILSSAGPGNAPVYSDAPDPAIQIGGGELLANPGASPADAAGVSLSGYLDAVLGSVQGSIVFRNATGWVTLPPGTAGYVLKTGGAGANPSWIVAAGIAFTYASTAPGSPNPGDLWVDSDTGIRYEFLNDGNSTQWVEF